MNRVPLVLGIVALVSACETGTVPPNGDVLSPSFGKLHNPPGGIVVPQGDPLIVVGGVTINHGGYGSALAQDSRDPDLFYSMTDRGANANITCSGATKLGFALPGLTPQIGKSRLSGKTVTLEGTISTPKADGTPPT